MTKILPTLPVGPLDLLVKAALAPPEIAHGAWRQWRQSYTLDETPWNEVRLLGAVAKRIDWLEPDADIVPRIKGIQKFLYAQTQVCLTGCMGAIAALSAADVPTIVMKGGGRVVLDGRAARERLVRDLDVLVPLSRMTDAFEALSAVGWTFKANGAWQAYWYRLDPIASHHAWSLAKDGAEIDLHHFSNHINRLEGDDDGLWMRAVKMEWRGFGICLPAPADSLLLSIVHGLRWSRECNADWLIDACNCLQGGEVDWQVFLMEAEERRVQAIVLTGLRYIRESLHQAIPEDVLARLEAGSTDLQMEELKVDATVPIPRTFKQNELMLAMVVRRCGPASAAQTATRHHVVQLTAMRFPLQYGFDIIPLAPDAEVVRLTVRMRTPRRPRAPLVGLICIMGLVLDQQIGAHEAVTPQYHVYDFVFTLPRRLLARRGVSRLCLMVGPSGETSFPPWAKWVDVQNPSVTTPS